MHYSWWCCLIQHFSSALKVRWSLILRTIDRKFGPWKRSTPLSLSFHAESSTESWLLHHESILNMLVDTFSQWEQAERQHARIFELLQQADKECSVLTLNISKGCYSNNCLMAIKRQDDNYIRKKKVGVISKSVCDFFTTILENVGLNRGSNNLFSQ